MDLPTNKLHGLDLFSGIGGLGLALQPWVQTVTYCERDPYAQAVLLSRQASGQLDTAPIWDDVTTLSGLRLPPLDIIFGGFPCTDISVAGLGKGLEGKHSGLFFEIVRLAEEIKPSFVFLENVPAIRTRGASRVCHELADRGYDLRWCTVSAQEVGALHLRNRWFLLAAHAERLQLRDQQGRGSGADREGRAFPRNDGEARVVAREGVGQADTEMRGRGKEHPFLGRFQEGSSPEGTERSGPPLSCTGSGVGLADSQRSGLEGHERETGEQEECQPWGGSASETYAEYRAAESGLGRLADDVSFRMERLRCLGNSVCPPQVREAFCRLLGLKAPEEG